MRTRLKTFAIVGLLLWSSATLTAQDVSIRRVSDHVMTLSMSNLGTHTNVTVVETAKGLVVIETEITPYIMSQIKRAAERKLGRDDWIYVINTHNHIHHAAGNCLFKETPIIGPETMNLNWLEDRLSTEAGRRQYCDNVGVNAAITGLRRSLSQATLTATQRQELRRRLTFCNAVRREIMAGFEVVNPTVTFRDRYELDLGDVHLRLVYWGDAINHSSIFVHVVEDKLLIGCGMGGPWLPNFYGNPTLESIRREIELRKEFSSDEAGIERLIGIHTAEPFVGTGHWQRRVAYLQDLLDDLTQAHQQGLTLEQAKQRFAFDTRYSRFRGDFTMPEDIAGEHRKNMETMWKLLDAEPSDPPNGEAQNAGAPTDAG